MSVLVHCLVLMALLFLFPGSSTKLTFSLWATQNDLMYWFCMVCFTETFNLSHQKKTILLWACIALAHGLLALPKISLWDFQYEPCNLHAFWFNLIYIFWIFFGFAYLNWWSYTLCTGSLSLHSQPSDFHYRLQPGPAQWYKLLMQPPKAPSEKKGP